MSPLQRRERRGKGRRVGGPDMGRSGLPDMTGSLVDEGSEEVWRSSGREGEEERGRVRENGQMLCKGLYSFFHCNSLFTKYISWQLQNQLLDYNYNLVHIRF